MDPCISNVMRMYLTVIKTSHTYSVPLARVTLGKGLIEAREMAQTQTHPATARTRTLYWLIT